MGAALGRYLRTTPCSRCSAKTAPMYKRPITDPEPKKSSFKRVPKKMKERKKGIQNAKYIFYKVQKYEIEMKKMKMYIKCFVILL